MPGKRRLPFLRWLAAAAAIAFGVVAYTYLTLPDVRPLVTTNPKTTAFMELRIQEADRAGKPFHFDQRWVPYSRISPNLRRAVLAAEDSAFWQHDGIDVEQIRLAVKQALERGDVPRGASTRTQQLANNLYLSPARNPLLKLRELVITRRLEAELSKQRIFEIYLNVVEWGDGVWGAEAAARRYFRKSAAELSASESALLAAAIANPHILDPGHPSARLRTRQQMIIRRMGAVTPPPVVAEPAQAPAVMPETPAVVPLPSLELPGTPVAQPTGRGSGGSAGQ